MKICLNTAVKTHPLLQNITALTLTSSISAYSVGETKVSRGPGRREIGHGALAEKALVPVLPSIEEFPYTIRAVSETFESNGSTSMASTCASCMSLMAAGVPIKAMVAGISCGLVTGDTDDDFLVLTDIQGLEDFFGDMDFKVTGTHKGITAIQMDIKIHGLTRPIVEEAIARTREARLYIMDEVMSKAIAEPRKEVNEWAPKIEQITIDPSKIGDVVGQKGKTINEIIDRTGVKIDITDDGAVSVCGTDKEMIAKAIDMIKIITTDFEQGQILEGTVVSIKEFGAFIEFAPGKDWSWKARTAISSRTETPIAANLCSLALHKVKVVCLGKDKMGRISFSMKDVKVFLFDLDFANEVLEKLLGSRYKSFLDMDEMARSALVEVGNIIICSYINAFSQLVNVEVELSVPSATINMLGGILMVPIAEYGYETDKLMYCNADFVIGGKALSDWLLMLPDIRSLNDILERLGVS